MSSYEHLLVEHDDGVTWVSLNRPEVRNAVNEKMQKELRDVWTKARYDNDVRCLVLTGEGKAFCTGADRAEAVNEENSKNIEQGIYPGYPTPWVYDDPGRDIGPKSCDLWKPVIAAVHGMACAAAFYMLGETDFIIASEDATFFDPHVTYGMTAAYEPTHMLTKMPFPELVRLYLMGNYERMSAQRAARDRPRLRGHARRRAARASGLGRARDRRTADARDPGHPARAVDRAGAVALPGDRAGQPVHADRHRRGQSSAPATPSSRRAGGSSGGCADPCYAGSGMS